MVADADLYGISNLFQGSKPIETTYVIAKPLANGEEIDDAAGQVKAPTAKSSHEEPSLSLLEGQGQAAIVNQELLRVHVSFDWQTPRPALQILTAFSRTCRPFTRALTGARRHPDI